MYVTDIANIQTKWCPFQVAIILGYNQIQVVWLIWICFINYTFCISSGCLSSSIVSLLRTTYSTLTVRNLNYDNELIDIKR